MCPFSVAYMYMCCHCLGNHTVEMSWVELPSHIQKTLSCSRCPGPVALRTFLHPPP